MQSGSAGRHAGSQGLHAAKAQQVSRQLALTSALQHPQGMVCCCWHHPGFVGLLQDKQGRQTQTKLLQAAKRQPTDKVKQTT
jgi:hypothetical protein